MSTLLFPEKSPNMLQNPCNRFLFCCLKHCANCHFYVLSPWAWVAVSLRAGTKLSLALQAPVVLSHLTYKAPTSKSTELHKLMVFSPSGFQSQTLQRFVFPMWAPWYEEPFLCLLCTCSSIPGGAPHHIFCPSQPPVYLLYIQLQSLFGQSSDYSLIYLHRCE